MPDEKTTGAEAVPETADVPAEPNLKNQLAGILVLIGVFGILWLLSKGMGPMGEWMGNGLSKVIGIAQVDEAKVKVEAESAAVVADDPVPIPAVATQKTGSTEKVVAESTAIVGIPIPEAFVKEQILEALGGPERGVVQHVAFSDDEMRLVAAVKLIDENGKDSLTEIIFERDEFGRYNSVDSSPVAQPIKIWPR